MGPLKGKGFVSPISVDVEFAAYQLGADVKDLRHLSVNNGNQILLVNIKFPEIKSSGSGRYVFEQNGVVSVKDCELRLDGSVSIEGKEYQSDTIPAPVGRVAAVFTVCPPRGDCI
jgi:hypothetical protein